MAGSRRGQSWVEEFAGGGQIVLAQGSSCLSKEEAALTCWLTLLESTHLGRYLDAICRCIDDNDELALPPIDLGATDPTTAKPEDAAHRRA